MTFKLDEGSREIPSIDNFKPLDKSTEKSLIEKEKIIPDSLQNTLE